MKRAILHGIGRAGVAALIALVAGGCTMKNQAAPPLAGPSTFGTAITVSVTPDVLTQDGASQALVTITARDAAGQPLRNLSLRTEIMVNGQLTDFGSLSARNLVTGSDGRATLVYTAPAAPAQSVDTLTVVDILVTPIGSDFNNSTTQLASIRLVPPGIVIPPDGLVARFTVTPSAPSDHQAVFFDASTSSASSTNPIVSYAWDFGDGGTGSGRTATHSYDVAGSFIAKVTISDAFGRSASAVQTVFVGQGAAPVPSFTFSPTTPQVNQDVSFNASASTAGSGRRIVSYTWDFGDGDQKTTESSTTTHDFVRAGTFQVTLTVTDDVGHIGSITRSVPVGSSGPTADFTVSPTDPAPGQTVFVNATASSPAQGHTIVSYTWDFGNGTGTSGTNPQASTVYTAEGTYTITLTVTDEAGNTGTTSKTVSVKFPS
ncbi:MAG: hypothetical protein A3H96_14600 [Acidobacteria bacterium RIFCSPLOWO2_02_FULL_67_36]|nr:MAG: hypothetical protein A3H96_14600 [Acidobacteria bacterium RIFCSPLOWO2_02_FULL_67_36]OFW18457.1 MAG: hypothetical protein A3G21_08110 [Acidobacteria bacterium RIFCSPLOWO2_12_FULL_66_21]